MHFHQLRKELAEITEILRTRCALGLKRRGLLSAYPAIPRHSRVDYERLLRTPIRQARFVVLDTETTGFEPYGGDELVQVAFVEYLGLVPTGRELSSLLHPRIPIPQRSTEIHGITDSMVADAPRAGELIDTIIEFTDDAVLVGHHIAFDLRFLNRITRRHRLGELPNPRIDTAMLHLATGGGREHIGLDHVAATHAIAIEGRHDARGDARTCGHIFAHLAGRLDDGRLTVGELIERVHPIVGLSPHHPAEAQMQGNHRTG